MNATSTREAESTLVAVGDHDQLHVRHFGGGWRNTTVVLLHGLFADGSLFYADGEALASQLARAGFDVWVPDLRGKGRSWPAWSREHPPAPDYGFHQAVTQDLATVLGLLRDAAPERPLFLVGQGSGGLLWLSFLARWPAVREMVRGLVLLGSAARHEPGAALAWRLRDGLLARWRGRRGLLAGPAGAVESARFQREVHALLDGGWIDPVDGLDHAARLAALPDWPPTLVVAAQCDAPWSGAGSARALQAALPPHDGRLYVFPAASGVRLLGPEGALAGGAGAGELRTLVLDWLANFDG